MTRTWVVVANNAMARLFVVAAADATMKELETIAHPEARLAERELTSDLPGRVSGGHGSARHALQSRVGPKEQQTIDFARLLAERIESGRTAHEFERLVLVASPAFLGHLRTALDTGSRRLVDGELDLDLTRLPPDEIRRRLPESFFPEAVK
jgi:protein required for attachment to host cells